MRIMDSLYTWIICYWNREKLVLLVKVAQVQCTLYKIIMVIFNEMQTLRRIIN